MNYEERSYEQFEEAVRTYFEGNSEEGTRIDIRTVLKNNGVKLRGLTVFLKDEKVTPTIYLEEFYNIYRQGTPLESVLSHMQTIYTERKQSENIEVQYFYQYDSVKDTLRIKLINYEKNEQFLQDVPYMRFLDLAVICYSLVTTNELANGTITIGQSHLDMWNVDKVRLFTDAVINSRKYAPEMLLKMTLLLEEMQKDLSEDLQIMFPPEENIGMHILTNCHKFNGAGVIFYPDVLEECASHMQSDLYVLPSSIHEVILLPVEEGNLDRLLSMVQDVNDEQVAEEEILSYHVYRYDRDEGRLEDVVTNDFVMFKDKS